MSEEIHRILVVDDEERIRRLLKMYLGERRLHDRGSRRRGDSAAPCDSE